MKVKTICFFLFLIPFSLSAQISHKDTLFAIWSDSTSASQARLDAFYELCYIDDDPPEMLPLELWYGEMDKVLSLAKSTGNEKYMSRFLVFASMYEAFELHKPELSCANAEKAMDFALEFKDYQSIIMLAPLYLNHLCQNENVKYNEAFLLDVLDTINIHISLPADLMFLYYQLSNYYMNKSLYPEALREYRKIVELSGENNITNPIVTLALEQIGTIHNEIGNYEEAENYLKKARNLNILLKDSLRLASTYVELTRLNIRTNNAEQAEIFIDSAIIIMKNQALNDAVCESCLNIAYSHKAGVLNLQNHYREALGILLANKKYYEPSDPATADNFGLIYFYSELAVSYFGLKNFREAIKSAEKGLQYSGKYSLSETMNNYKILYQSQEKLGDYSQALSAYKNLVNVKDTMAILRNAQEVTRLELENAFQQERFADSLSVAKTMMTNEIEFQNKLNFQRRNKNIFIALGVFIFFIATGLYYRLRYVRKTQKLLSEKNRIIEAEKEKAKASERAKQQFLANMSHEIRTPINAVKGMIDILIRRNPKADQLKYLNGIKESSDSLLVIINDILDLSKIEVGKVDLENIPFSLSEVVENVHTIMQFKAEEKGLELITDIPGNTPQVMGDPARLRQVILNLVGNAVKFTERGKVCTSLIIEDGKNDFEINAHFIVSDTGIGIDESHVEKIFSSFEQAYSDTSRKFGGTGLGLSISTKLIELHNGKIWLESEKGKGSQFHFIIPYEITQEQGNKTLSSTSAYTENISEKLKGIKLLLVEDNAFNAIVAKEELEDSIQEVHVTVAENGSIALEQIQTEQFDLILMDVQMPVMNGYDATKAIRNFEDEKSKIPIIAMTANVMKEEVDLCFESGMNDFIGKPFDIGELLQKIDTLTNRQS